MGEIDKNWKETANTVDLTTLGAADPFEGLDSYLATRARDILKERARDLSQEELLEAYAHGRFGKYGYSISDLLDAPGRWGYRDREDDAKELAKAVKKKGADPGAVVLPMVRAARDRFDFVEGHVGSWAPLHSTSKTRLKLLSLAVEGAIEVPAEDRCILSPFNSATTRELAAAGPLPLVEFRSKDKWEYRDPFSEKSKSAAPSYAERYLVTWAEGANARWGGQAITPIREPVLLRKKPWTLWAYLAQSRSYIAVNKAGEFMRVVAHTRAPEKAGLSAEVRVTSHAVQERGSAVSLMAWVSKTHDEVKAELLAELPDEVATACTLGATVLAELYGAGGCVEPDGSLRLPEGTVNSGAFRVGFSRETYANVEDGPPGPYHDLAYSDDSQSSLCIRANDDAADPAVYEIDSENFLRGRRGALSSFIANIQPCV